MHNIESQCFLTVCRFIYTDSLGHHSFVYIFYSLCKEGFIEAGCDLRALDACYMTPFRILKNGIQQTAEIFFGFIFEAVLTFYQNIIQTGISSAQKGKTIGGCFNIGKTLGFAGRCAYEDITQLIVFMYF